MFRKFVFILAAAAILVPAAALADTSSTGMLAQLTSKLHMGDSGQQVSTLQALLASDPSVYPQGLVTGYYGPLTQQAVKNYQAQHGLDQVGYVGPQTLQDLQTQLQQQPLQLETAGQNGQNGQNGANGQTVQSGQQLCIPSTNGPWSSYASNESQTLPVCSNAETSSFSVPTTSVADLFQQCPSETQGVTIAWPKNDPCPNFPSESSIAAQASSTMSSVQSSIANLFQQCPSETAGTTITWPKSAPCPQTNYGQESASSSSSYTYTPPTIPTTTVSDLFQECPIGGHTIPWPKNGPCPNFQVQVPTVSTSTVSAPDYLTQCPSFVPGKSIPWPKSIPCPSLPNVSSMTQSSQSLSDQIASSTMSSVQSSIANLFQQCPSETQGVTITWPKSQSCPNFSSIGASVQQAASAASSTASSVQSTISNMFMQCPSSVQGVTLTWPKSQPCPQVNIQNLQNQIQNQIQDQSNQSQSSGASLQNGAPGQPGEPGQTEISGQQSEGNPPAMQTCTISVSGQNISIPFPASETCPQVNSETGSENSNSGSDSVSNSGSSSVTNSGSNSVSNTVSSPSSYSASNPFSNAVPNAMSKWSGNMSNSGIWNFTQSAQGQNSASDSGLTCSLKLPSYTANVPWPSGLPCTGSVPGL